MKKTCLNCGKEFSIPACRDWREHCCSSLCKKEYRAKKAEELRSSRTRKCLVCGRDFVVKASQIEQCAGKYCSHKCQGIDKSGIPKTADERKKISEGQYRAMKEGRLIHKSGDQHPNWKGGEKLSVRRRIISGKAKETLRAYRKNNPEKVREWAHRRGEIKQGRLPKGTVASLMELQQCKCAICRVSIKKKYHVDHIVPLALGGKHERFNIQLLCPSCNVRKWATDPIVYMQNNGMLL